MNENIIISILSFAGTLLLCYSVYYYFRAQADKRRIVEKISRQGSPEALHVAQGNADASTGIIKKSFVDLATRLGQYSTRKSDKEQSHRKQKLIIAGFREKNAPVIFYGLKILLAILFPVVVYPLLRFLGVPLDAMRSLILMLLLALFGFYLPDLGLNMVITRRQKEITDGFPDALDLMVVCVEAGMGLGQAIKRISDEMEISYKILSREFSLMSLEMRAGRSRQDAMRNLATRTDVDDVKSLVTLLLQTEKFGTSIAQALRVHSDTMRTNRRQRAEEKAMKLPVKLLIPMILFIFPSMFVVMIGPGAINIYRALINH